MGLYSFFGARGIGTNGASALVFNKDFYFDEVTRKQGFSSDLKKHIARFPDGEFFYNRPMDRLFLSLAVRKKSSNFTHT